MLTSERFSLSRFYPAIKDYLKPVQSSAPNIDKADNILKDKR